MASPDSSRATCPRCGSSEIYVVNDSRSLRTQLWECGDCEKKFHMARARPAVPE
ncbi:transposase [Mycobacterium sp. IDR2000157661]|uniref:transposase n=1 Tax=Mycobacterium sp. IDR2000157661 TaxID=2867005 RepID=UPI00351CB8C8